jgi:iron complex outermembrane receptor protein
VFNTRDPGIEGLELSGSVTYLDARTLALTGRASATAPEGSAIGKFLPNIPKWRGNISATYRPIDPLSLTLAGRYSDKIFTTLDNADINPNTYQGFADWFVADARVNYKFQQHLSGSLGVDNLFNRKYFLFHPFPQRTLVATIKADL